MARGPIEPAAPVPRPPSLVTLRITAPEAARIVRALRAAHDNQLAGVVLYQAELTTRHWEVWQRGRQGHRV